MRTSWRDQKFTPVRDNVWVQTDRKHSDGVNERKNESCNESACVRMRDVRADYALQGLCEAWSWLRLLLHKQISSSSTTVASLHSRYMLYIDYIFERLYNGQWYLLARFFLCTLALCMTMNEKKDIKLKFWQKLVSRKKAGSKVTKRSGGQKGSK